MRRQPRRAGGRPAAGPGRSRRSRRRAPRPICFAPALSLARKLVRSGADALVIEGMEAGGHIGPVATSVLAQEILPHMQRRAGVRGRRHRPRRGHRQLPGDGRGRLPARFALRLRHGERSPTPHSRRRSCAHPPATRSPSIQIDARFPVIPVRALSNAATRRFRREAARSDRPLRRGRRWTRRQAQLEIEHYWAGALRRAVIDGDVENGSVMAGQSVGMVTREEPVADIIAELVAQAEAALARG
jgi:enoyl-[acyl-carrier protein] reductase II